MGGQQSTRKLTISNNDPTNVIKVSDAVVQRFKGENQASKKDEEKPSVTVTPPPASSTAPAPAAAAAAAAVAAVAEKHHEIPLHQYLTSNTYQPRITSLQVRQEKEAELRANDLHWQKRICQLEETHQKINQLMEQEYNCAMNEVKGEIVTSCKTRGAVCVEGKKAVMQCYKDNPKEPMKCAQAVQAFAECVDKHRSALVANRG